MQWFSVLTAFLQLLQLVWISFWTIHYSARNNYLDLRTDLLIDFLFYFQTNPVKSSSKYRTTLRLPWWMPLELSESMYPKLFFYFDVPETTACQRAKGKLIHGYHIRSSSSSLLGRGSSFVEHLSSWPVLGMDITEVKSLVWHQSML